MIVAFEPEALIDALIEVEPVAAARRYEVRVVRAPGLVNLIGEHTDYNEGLVLPAAIDLEIRVDAGARATEGRRLSPGQAMRPAPSAAWTGRTMGVRPVRGG